MRLIVAAGAAVALGFGVGAAHAAVVAPATDSCSHTICDGVRLKSGGVSVHFAVTNESKEFFVEKRAAPTPPGFTNGTIYLTEPGTGNARVISDAFTLINDPGHLNVYFISDGASPGQQALFKSVTRHEFLPETGHWQDVSSFFGQAPGFARIISDVPGIVQHGGVPEPGTWAMMIVGVGAIGAMTRRNRRLHSAAA
jgi:hypothetical protein